MCRLGSLVYVKIVDMRNLGNEDRPHSRVHSIFLGPKITLSYLGSGLNPKFSKGILIKIIVKLGKNIS
jgi:hypothetical protein